MVKNENFFRKLVNFLKFLYIFPFLYECFSFLFSLKFQSKNYAQNYAQKNEKKICNWIRALEREQSSMKVEYKAVDCG